MSKFQRRVVLWTLLAAFAWGLPTLSLRAHFVWVETNQGKVLVYFGEGVQPDQAKLLQNVAQLKVQQWQDGRWQNIAVAPQVQGDLGWYQSEANSAADVVNVNCPYGVLQRENQSFRLHYQAHYFSAAAMKQLTSPVASVWADVELAIIPEIVDGQLTLRCLHRGQPVAGVEVTVIAGADSEQPSVSDAQGRVALAPNAARLVVRGKWVNPEAGTWQDKSFNETRYYTTAVFECEPAQAAMDPQTAVGTNPALSLPLLPVGLTSFGAVELGRKVYVFGGQLGDSHNYAAELQNNCLYALDLAHPEQWTEVHRDRGLQGLALVSDGQRLIRLGGFAARNEEGDAQDLHSSDQVEQFNFQQNRWEALPSLPEPRSSFDAVVIDGQIYVVGGWKQSGAGTTPQWLETAYRLDLKQLDRGWQALPKPPFQRRAVALGQVDGQLVVVGGMNSDGRPTTAVAVFDVAKQTWREGPSLPPGDGMEGFGSSCFNVGGQLICSTYSGAIYRLDAQRQAWESIGQLDPPRFFHRLIPIAANEFAILGGVNMDRGKILEIYRQTLNQ